MQVHPPEHGRRIVLVLPARNEEATVAAVVARIPRQVHGYATVCVVVDDGSTDATAERARSAGAHVVPSARPGLGAAVATGLRAAADHGPVAVAFCDADGEYAPEELGRLVAPILDGTADYVVGSRFAGAATDMLRHRAAGNRLLTWLVRRLTHAPITDGQSGFRALSAEAAADARIAHDYNYAQVLTLDLLGRGYRYAEVPITYRRRRQGQSFVRLVPYLGHVLPAMWRARQGAAEEVAWERERAPSSSPAPPRAWGPPPPSGSAPTAAASSASI